MRGTRKTTTLDAGLWDGLAELADALAAPADLGERSHAADALTRAGWDLIAAHVQRGALTHSDAYAAFSRLRQLIDSTRFEDLAHAFKREALQDGRQPLAVPARRYLDTHLADEVTLDEVAGAVGASVRCVSHAFRTRHRVSVHTYLIRRRVAAAVRLLVETDLKVAAVAAAVGFGHASTLHRHIRRLLHTTPRAIRQRHGDGAMVDELLARLEEPEERGDTSRG